MHDVVVTGIGMVTPLGATASETADAWSRGTEAERRRIPELAGTSLERAEAAVLPPFDAAARLGGRRMLKYMSGAALLGCLAAREAASEAGLAARFRPERIGLYAGSGLAAASVADVHTMIDASIDASGAFCCRRFGEHGLAATNPLLSFKILANMPPCLVSILECVRGPNLIFTPWEGQTGAALVEAWRAVAAGEVDAALAGAADAPDHPGIFVYLKQAGLLPDGQWPAPGAAYLVMERAETAFRDRKKIYAHLETLDVTDVGEPPADPLAARIGRTFAAAPAILLGLACGTQQTAATLTGARGVRFRARWRRPA